MYNPYNLEANLRLDAFLRNFARSLSAEKAAPITQRSYLSDVRFFFRWLIPFLTDNHQIEADFALSSLLEKINPKNLAAYEDYLQNGEMPLKSVNRKFSALRKLGSFCLSQNLITENIFASLKNVRRPIVFPEKTYRLGEFTTELLARGAGKLTVKNYLSDVRQFLLWTKGKFEI